MASMLNPTWTFIFQNSVSHSQSLFFQNLRPGYKRPVRASEMFTSPLSSDQHKGTPSLSR